MKRLNDLSNTILKEFPEINKEINVIKDLGGEMSKVLLEDESNSGEFPQRFPYQFYFKCFVEKNIFNNPMKYLENTGAFDESPFDESSFDEREDGETKNVRYTKLGLGFIDIDFYLKNQQ